LLAASTSTLKRKLAPLPHRRGCQTLFSRRKLRTRSVAGQSPTKIPQRSA
jgi:hypothetical protein